MVADDLRFLPTLNAVLNATSALFLVAGYLFIRRRRVAVHKACMVTAFLVSSAFLVSYLVYHAQVGSVRFEGTGWLRGAYLAILIPHTILAAVIVPLAIATIWLARHERFAKHRRLARWTLPLWLYVSVSGVAVYWMLYHMA
ncbi:MAG: DUF420 domain-containing protein [Acidobacteriota bacterium]